MGRGARQHSLYLAVGEPGRHAAETAGVRRRLSELHGAVRLERRRRRHADLRRTYQLGVQPPDAADELSRRFERPAFEHRRPRRPRHQHQRLFLRQGRLRESVGNGAGGQRILLQRQRPRQHVVGRRQVHLSRQVCAVRRGAGRYREQCGTVVSSARSTAR